MAERIIGAATRKKLINNEPFAYAHLVKFERPSSTLRNGNYSTDAKRYAYFTDATHNISFDDQSNNTAGNNNGTQTYIAGKLLDVGTYSETVQARASGMSLTLAAESLNNTITSTGISMTSSTITMPTGIDLVDEGFREGDKVFISGGSNSGQYINVVGIKTNNTVLLVSNIDSTLGTQNAGTSITLSIVSDELQGPLGETNLSTVKSYANRDVWVYKAFIDPETGALLDNVPVLIFKGIITKADIVESPGGSVKAKWSLTSHWGDFAMVRGRPTNDAIHRALDNQNRGQPEVSLRPEYAHDLGFLHAEETLNILATYTTIEQETKYKMKKKWYGKVKMSEVVTDVDVENEVDLSFSLSSKYLPVIYGVQRASGIPFFVDTKANDPNNVYLAHAICEGEIGGLYDLYIEGNPLICMNKPDSDDRDSVNGNKLESIEVHCRGRSDLGHTLGGVQISGNGITGSNAADYTFGNSYKGYDRHGYEPTEDFIEAQIGRYHEVNDSLLNADALAAKTTDGTGVIHEQTITLQHPNNMDITLHTGKIDQKADDLMVQIASASGDNKFKRQADYYTGDEDYWGPNHRVLDTAYTIMNVEIGEDATTVPEVEYIVRGKLCSSYNYDYSYAHVGTSETVSNFKIGDKVVLHRTDTDAVINSSVQIIDKWSFADPDGNIQYRFRFSIAPALGYSGGYATIKGFYMKNSSNQTWTMGTWDYTDESHSAGTVPSANTSTVTVNDNGASPVTITIPSNLDFINELVLDLQHVDYAQLKFVSNIFAYGFDPFWFLKSSSTLLTHAGTGGTSHGIQAGSQTIISANTIKLASGASSSDDTYNNFDIELTRTSTAEDGSSQTQSWTRTIVDYDGGTKTATVNTAWEGTFEPAANDTYKLLSKIKNGRTDDKRVSINPTIQLLDYLTGRYGKALDLYTDISLADFLLAARTCDDRGTQTLQGTDIGASNVGKRYVLTSDGTTSGSVVAMGLVKSRGTSNSVGYTEFQQVFGKFTKKFMSTDYAYSVGDIIHTDVGYYRVTSAGVKASAPSGTNPAGYTGPHASVPLFYINDNGAISGSAISFTRVKDGIYGNPCAVYNSATGGYDTGYSLYDSDHVKYWRYYGWDDKHQRFATRHQTQGTVSTADSVFANVNGFLANFNGMLSYEGGKYALRIETSSDNIASTVITAANAGSYSGYTKGSQYNPRVINDDDIIGNLSVTDKGTAKSYNTVSASIMDPANKFKGRAVSFYDSNYLRADKNVVKSGNINIASVSNYYNARINVENYLRKSRFGLSISFKTGPKSVMLLAGDTISITNQKFGFVNKYFRIENINYAKDCTATISAHEYDDSYYSISAPTLPSVISQDQRQGLQANPAAPSNFSASVSDNVLGGVNLAWTNPSGLTAANCFTEVWFHTGPLNINQVESNGSRHPGSPPFPANTLVDQIGKKDVARYYWIRSGKIVTLTSGGQNKVKPLYSAFVGPANATTVAPTPIFGVSLAGDIIFTSSTGTLSPSSIVLATKRDNSEGDVAYTAVNNSGSSVTLTSASNTAVTLTSGNFGSASSVTITATLTTTSAERLQGAQNTYSDTHTITKINQGLQGTSAKTVHLTVDDYSIVYDVNGANPSPSGNMTLTATAQGFTNAFFRFTGDGISDQSSYTDGNSANADAFTFTVPSSFFSTPKTLRVGVAEGNQTEVAFDTISIFAVKPGATGPAGVDGMTFINTNPTHTFPASSAGAVSSFADSGTTFEVYEGATELSFDGTGTANSKWKVVASTQTNISVGGFTDNGDSMTVGNHSGVANGTDLSRIVYSISGKRADGEAFSVALEQTFAKAKAGGAGVSAPRNLVSFVYHQASSTNQPQTPSATSYNITNNTFSGLSQGWATTPPTFAAGNANKYWYSYFRAEENSAGGAVASGSNLSFIAAQQGIGFSGLVTFSSGNVIDDGAGNTLSFGQNGTTTIDGGKITTGTIAANRISISGKNISELNNNSGFTNDDAANAAQSTANAAQTAQEVATAIANDTTVIDGARITTGTVAAARLDVSNILIGSLNNNSGFTNNDAANAAQSTANTANSAAGTAQSTANSKTTASAAAAAANAAAKTAGTVGGWAINSTAITSGNITLNNSTNQILITD